MRKREQWRLKESDGEKGNKKHLPSLLESTAVIMELRRKERGRKRAEVRTRKESHTMFFYKRKR